MKIFRYILPLFLAAALLAGCDNAKKNPDESGKTEEKVEAVIVDSGASEYRIVYPGDADTGIFRAAKHLQEKITEITGVTLEMEADYLKRGQTHDEDKKRILVGLTNYDESQEVMKGLKYYDYTVKCVGDKLVIGAYGEEELTDAVDKLIESVVVKYSADVGTLSFSGEITDKYGDYMVDKFNVCGIGLENFDIVYGSDVTEDVAKKFRDEFAHRSGFYLNLKKASEKEHSEKEILIGNTGRAASDKVSVPTYLNYTVAVSDGNIVVKTGGIHSLNKLMTTFATLFVSERKDDVINLDENFAKNGDYYDDPFTYQSPEGTDVRVMSCNILAEFPTWNGKIPVDERKEIFFSALEFYKPTVIGLQEFSPQWVKTVKEYREYDKYGLLLTEKPDGTGYYYSGIMYRSDLYNLVASGSKYYDKFNNASCRIMCWAIFEVKETGKRFGFFNTHWDGDVSENSVVQYTEATNKVNDLKSTYGVPVFCTADWNSNEHTTAYKQFMSGANLQNAKYVAKNLLNSIGSWHDIGLKTPSVNSCDHIFTTKDVTVLQFETQINNEQYYGSDHSWLYADIKFN